MTAVGALAVRVLRYSSDINNRRREEIKKITLKPKKIITKLRTHHPKADRDSLYVECKEGGRGLLQIKGTYKTEIINIAEYLKTKIMRVNL